MQDSKKCFKCLETKPLEQFYRHRAMADGRLNKCMSCTKIDVFRHRMNNLETIREYDRTRGARKYKKPSKLQMRAHNAVQRNVKKQPCIFCGSVMVHGHHDDYSKPLEVMWLCAVHHKGRHAYLKYIGEHP